MKYKCSCCNELKSTRNIVYRIWTQKVRPSMSKIVGICRKCNNLIKKRKNVVGVKEFIDWVGI